MTVGKLPPFAPNKAPPFAFGSSIWPGLAKLIEEAGEVGQVAGKLVMTGGERQHWDGTDLQTRLIQEMADVVAAVQFVSVYNLTDLEVVELEERVAKKLQQFIDWHVFGERNEPAKT